MTQGETVSQSDPPFPLHIWGGGGLATRMLLIMGLKKPMGGIMSATATFYPAFDQNPKWDLSLNRNKWFCCLILTKMCGLLGIYCFSLDLHVWFGKDFMTVIPPDATLSIYPDSGPAIIPPLCGKYCSTCTFAQQVKDLLVWLWEKSQISLGFRQDEVLLLLILSKIWISVAFYWNPSTLFDIFH